MLLIKRDLRKRPGQAITLLVLAILAAAMLHTALVLVADYSTNIDRRAAEWNSPSTVALVTGGAPAHEAARLLADDPAVTASEVVDSFGATGTFALGAERLTSLVNVINLDDDGHIGRSVVVEAGPAVENPIWAPAMFAAAGAYSLGDEIAIETTQGTSTFHIAGFIEDLYGGAPGMGMLTFGLPADRFASFDAAGFTPTANLRAQGDDVAAATMAVEKALESVQPATSGGHPAMAIWSTDINMAKSAAAMSSSIFVAMLAALALVIVLIAAVVTRFVLRNLITTDMVSIGTLRAAGFTTWRIIGSLVATNVAVTAIGSLIGAGLSYLLLPAMARSFQAQNGISWEPRFSWFALVVTLAAMLVVIVVSAGMAALRVRRATTVGALRGGIATHNFTSTRLPLATTRGSLPLLLGLKSGLRQSAQNALLALTVAIVAFAAVFTIGMVDNLLGDRTKATQMMVGAVEDVSIQPAQTADVDALLADVRTLPGVDRAFFQTMTGIVVEGRPIGFSITPDPSADAFDPLVEGRLPKHDNEVAVGGKLARDLDLDVGSTYTLDLGAGPADFLVTGITSSARNLGWNLNLSSDGFRRLEPSFRDHIIAVYAPDPEAVIATVKERFGTSLDSVSNQRENVEAQLGSYLTMVPIISTFMISFTLIVTVLVVGLVVTTMLVQTHRDLGIKKAMGFTNRQLSAQTRWTYLPAVAGGAVVGAVIGAIGQAPLLTLLLSQIGIMRMEISTNWLATAVIALAIAAAGALIMWISSLRIGRISAYALVTE